MQIFSCDRKKADVWWLEEEGDASEGSEEWPTGSKLLLV